MTSEDLVNQSHTSARNSALLPHSTRRLTCHLNSPPQGSSTACSEPASPPSVATSGGYSTEAVVVTALLVALAIVALGIIAAKVIGKANSISTS